MRHGIAGSTLLTIVAVIGPQMFVGARAQNAASTDSHAVIVPAAAQFLGESTAAMDKMMAAMHVEPTGDVDADFAAMMIPHHQGAIDMALAELRYGKNEQLRRIAQEIIVEQQQEIAAMRLALGQPLPAPAPAPTQVSPFHEASAAKPVHDRAATAHGSVPASPQCE